MVEWPGAACGLCRSVNAEEILRKDHLRARQLRQYGTMIEVSDAWRTQSLDGLYLTTYDVLKVLSGLF